MKKNIFVNLFGQLASFVCSIGISFFLTPYIVSSLGKEVYGFVGLANNFTSYISLITIALSGMLSRYVTIEYSKKNYEKASGYFSTAIITQIIIALVLVVPVMLFTVNLDAFIDISAENVPDVTILWILMFTAFLVNIPMNSFGIGTFVRNRLDISAAISIICNLVRAGVLVVAFVFFTPKVWYMGLATICSNIFSISMNYYKSKKLMPEVKVKKKYFDKKYIYDLVVVGIWNSLNRLQQILYSGLDLLLTNLFINAGEMGLLSIAKTLPSHISTLIGTVSNSFDPTMTISYSKEDKTEFLQDTDFAMKLNGFLCSIPILGVIAFGLDFYGLWMPSLSDAELLKVQILAVLTLLPQVFSVYIYPLYTVNTITCKLKVPVTLSLIIGVMNIIIVFLLLKFTSLGVYAVAGVSSVLWIFRIFLFVPTYAAHNVNVKWTTFYGPLLRGVVNIILTGGIFVLVSTFIETNTWLEFIVVCGICAIVGYIICFFIMFSKSERKKAVSAIKRKLKRR